VRVLRLLAGTNHVVAAVATTPDAAAADGATVAALARRLGLPLLEARAVRDAAFAETVASLGVDVLLNVSSLHVAAPETVAAPRIGSFNLHPGPLPEYAGLNVPSWAIYAGEAEHAVTLHWMTAEVDAGAIAYRQSFPIEERDTGLTLTLKCVEHGLPLVSQLLADAATGAAAVPALEQDPSGGRFFGAGVPDGGAVRWTRPARRIVDFVRACDYLPFASPWGHPRTAVAPSGTGGFEVVKAARTHEGAEEPPGTVVRLDETGAVVAAVDERLLVERVRLEGEHAAPACVLRPGLRLVADPARDGLDA
jgi:UDP-4-amino-4-deoxy-L-arabinose formyltransferase/UDP-glucuronic acid dehydrogenase (UDP-4-keto-hexauronic acid decarboxylating)